MFVRRYNKTATVRGGCCGGEMSKVHQNFGQRGFHPAVTRYCDTIPLGTDADPEMIGEIIRDLHCVFEKTYGRKANVEARFRHLACEVEDLKDDLACCECCKEELENELIKLHPELKALQFALEEEIQKRACLDSIINQLRAQLARADAMLDADCRDKAAMQSKMKDLEAQLNKLQDIIDCLSSEREDLLRNCRQFEDYKLRQADSTNSCCQRMEQLEEALAKCCKANEELQKELVIICKDREDLLKSLEACQKEKMQMADEFDRQRRQWLKERERLEQTISDLRKAVECLTAQNQEICDKMREVVAAHHREMDSLKREADKFRRLYDKENKDKIKAQEASKKCQEQLRRTVAECRDKMTERTTVVESVGTYNNSNPCAEILARINARNWGGGGGGGAGSSSAAAGGGGGGIGFSSSSGSKIRGGNDSQGGGGSSTTTKNGGTSANTSGTANDTQQVSKLQNQLRVSQMANAEQSQRIQSLEARVEELKMEAADKKTRHKGNVNEEEEENDSNNCCSENDYYTNYDEEDEVSEKNKLHNQCESRSTMTLGQVMIEADFQALQEKLRTSETSRLNQEEKNSQLETKLWRLQQDLSVTVAERKTVQVELERMTRKNLSLQEVMEREQKFRIKVQQNLDESEDRTRQEIKEKEKLQQKIDMMETNQNNNKILDRNQNTQTDDLDQLREKLKNEEQRSEELQLKLETAEEFHRMRSEEFLDQLKILQDKLETDITKLRGLEKVVRDGEQEKIRLTELNRHLEECGQRQLDEIGNLQNQLRLAQQETKDLKNHLEDKKTEMEDLKMGKSSEKSEIEQLTRQLKTASAEAEELRDELNKICDQKCEQEQLLKEYKEKLDSLEPKMVDYENQRRVLEQRLAAMIDKNSRWKMIGEEHRVSLDLVQRELKDVQKMWETEVKAKGILAEKIAKYERTSSLTDAKAKQEAEHYDRIKEKARQLKTELKAEREQTNKLKVKIDLLKEQCRSARDQLQEMTNDPRSQQLMAQIERQKADHDQAIQVIVKEREALMVEFYRLGQEKMSLETEVRELRGLQSENTRHKESIDNLMAAKERLESEMLQIKTLVNKRYVEKSVVDAMRQEHAASLEALKKQFETQAEQELNTKLTQIGTMIDSQNRDRTMIDSMRTANEKTLRLEFNSMVKNMKLDMERLNGLLKAREEEITTLRSCVNKFKDKVTTEAMQKNELIRKLQRLTSASQESVMA